MSLIQDKGTSYEIGNILRFAVPETTSFCDFFFCSWLWFVRIILTIFSIKFLFCIETVSRLVCAKTILTKWHLDINSLGRRKETWQVTQHFLQTFIKTLKTLCWRKLEPPLCLPFLIKGGTNGAWSACAQIFARWRLCIGAVYHHVDGKLLLSSKSGNLLLVLKN